MNRKTYGLWPSANVFSKFAFVTEKPNLYSRLKCFSVDWRDELSGLRLISPSLRQDTLHLM